ncbi:hypothetical protein AGMMS49941_06860 [Deferribacterales bacterium]|nr:hypothetical protein AGMMS49941_06860 [Deferribacterales bacterium]
MIDVGLTEASRIALHAITDGRTDISLDFISDAAVVAEYKDRLGSVYAGRYPLSAFYRVFAPQIFPDLDKLLYLDCDIIVRRDVAELFNTALGDNELGGARDLWISSLPDSHPLSGYFRKLGVSKCDYVNSGVLLMNLARMRKGNFIDRVVGILRDVKQLHFADNDLLNICCKGRIAYISSAWNTIMTSKFYRLTGCQPIVDKDVAIFHYAGAPQCRPWNVFSGVARLFTACSGFLYFYPYLARSPLKGQLNVSFWSKAFNSAKLVIFCLVRGLGIHIGRDMLMGMRFFKALQQLYYVSSVKGWNYSQLSVPFKRLLKLVLPPYCFRLPIHKLEIHLAEHCNLGCYSCSHFSQLAEAEFANIDSFIHDMERMRELTSRYKRGIDVIHLMGGEPLLHPDIIPFFRVARENFPQTDIKLVTNGLLLLQQKAEFWEAIKRYNIKVSPTKYPVVDWQRVDEYAASFDCKLDYFQNIVVKFSQQYPLDLQGSGDVKLNYAKCFMANACLMLRDGKLATCSVILNIHHFNKHFGEHVPLTSNDYVDIHEVANIDEVINFLASPVPMCRYCGVDGRRTVGEWRHTEKTIGEYITFSS